MTPNEMRTLLRKRPFEPFRIRLADGSSYDIKYPELNLASDLRLVVGIPDTQDPACGIADHCEFVAWSQITGVEALATPAAV